MKGETVEKKIVTPGAPQIEVYCKCGCDHILRSEVIDGVWMVEFGKCKHGDNMNGNIHAVLSKKALQ